MFAKRPEWAKAKRAFAGKRYCIDCTYYGEGEVFSFDEQRIALRFHNEPSVRHYSYGWVWLPEFVVADSDGRELVRISRKKRFPRPLFEL